MSTTMLWIWAGVIVVVSIITIAFSISTTRTVLKVMKAIQENQDEEWMK